jgi:hypothetical protein
MSVIYRHTGSYRPPCSASEAETGCQPLDHSYSAMLRKLNFEARVVVDAHDSGWYATRFLETLLVEVGGNEAGRSDKQQTCNLGMLVSNSHL